jgi:hypothetical protein
MPARPIINDAEYDALEARIGSEATKVMFRKLADIRACRHDLTHVTCEESMIAYWNVTNFVVTEHCEDCEMTRTIMEITGITHDDLPTW